MATLVQEPRWGPEMFLSDSEQADLTAAATLLLLREQFLIAAEVTGNELSASADAIGASSLGRELDNQRVPWAHGFVDDAVENVLRGGQTRRGTARSRQEWQAFSARSVEMYFGRRDASSAANIILASTTHPSALVRVSAMAAANAIVPTSIRERDLVGLAGSDDELVRTLAGTLLFQAFPGSALLSQAFGPPPNLNDELQTSVLIHGTFARSAVWWRPGSSFHNHMLGVRPDLYNGPDPFSWSGAYTRDLMVQGALGLLAWVRRHAANELDTVFGHSHGGTVAMLATLGGLPIRTIGLLSCPVHWSHFRPDFNNVRHVVHIRVHLDLVVLLDRGGQEFKDPRISDICLPLWFDHSATHDERVWQAHNVANYF